MVGGCERIFSSPVPPTMSRHAIRCLFLWLFGLPFALAGSTAPAAAAVWVFLTSYLRESILALHLSAVTHHRRYTSQPRR